MAPHAITAAPGRTRKRIVDLKPPFAKRIEEAGEIIFSAPDVGAVRVIEPPLKRSDGGSAVFFFAREADIRAVLNDDETYTLHPYDVALSAAAGDVRFLLGAKSDAMRDRRAIVEKVVGAPGSSAYNAITDRVRVAAREASAEFMAHLRRRPPEPFRFNVIRNYGYLIPYLTTSRVVGVSGPNDPTLLVRAMVWFRNISGAKHWLSLGPEQKRCQTIVMWSHLIFGHIFTNFENRDRLLLTLARKASREFNDHLERLMARNEPRFETALISDFLNMRSYFPHIPNDVYRAYVRSILFEFTGAMTLLVSISFGRILHTLASRGASWADFLAEVRGEQGERLIEEAMRPNTTTKFLFRRVAKRAEIADVELHPGDHVCVLIGACGKAGGAFRDAPPANSAQLNFGPHGGPHSCLGQAWARVILQEMLGAMADSERLRPAEGATHVHEFRGLPDEFEMFLAPPPTP